MKKIWVSCLLLLMIGALKSQNNFFPVDGITPGKTTVSEVKSRGYKFEKNRYFYIMSHFFYDFDGDNILEYFYTESGHVMPFLWVENFGFNWNLSYSDWMDILKKAGFVIKVNKEPQTRNWQGRNTLEARFTAFSPSGYTKFEFNQDGSKKGFDFLNAYYEWETNYRKSLNGLNSRIIESDKQKNYMVFQLFGQYKENNINVFYLIKMPKNILNTISISSAKWDDDKKISFLRGLNQ